MLVDPVFLSDGSNLGGFSRDHAVGKNARELFAPVSADGIEATDRAALDSPDGQFRNEFEVDRAGERRMVASIRIVVRSKPVSANSSRAASRIVASVRRRRSSRVTGRPSDVTHLTLRALTVERTTVYGR